MRRSRRDPRGLAEIVGTLMLVVIVVAAAVAFSLFVASYQTQVQNEQRAAHDRGLERIHFLNLSVGGGGFPVNVTFVSADVNYMNFTGYVLGGFSVQSWRFYPEGNSVPSWMGSSGCLNTTSVVTKEACETVRPYQSVSAVLIPYHPVTSPIQLGIFTALANEFQFSFVAPVAIASVYFVPTSPPGNTTPVFDGSGSYQPTEGDNATLLSYVWTIHPKGSVSVVGSGSGVRFEDSSLAKGNYTVVLTVTNTDGLVGATSIPYVQQT